MCVQTNQAFPRERILLFNLDFLIISQINEKPPLHYVCWPSLGNSCSANNPPWPFVTSARATAETLVLPKEKGVKKAEEKENHSTTWNPLKHEESMKGLRFQAFRSFPCNSTSHLNLLESMLNNDILMWCSRVLSLTVAHRRNAWVKRWGGCSFSEQAELHKTSPAGLNGSGLMNSDTE